MPGEGTAGRTAEIVTKKYARSRHQPQLWDEQLQTDSHHTRPGLTESSHYFEALQKLSKTCVGDSRGGHRLRRRRKKLTVS